MIKIQSSAKFSWLMLVALALSVLFTIDLSFANEGSGPTQLTGALCNVVELLTGTIGKAIATIAIVFLAFMLFVGKISWGVAIATAIGIAAIPAAPQIVNFLSSTGSGAASGTLDECGTGN